MGRKNRNARGRSYASFAELKGASARFDLSKGTFLTRKSGGGGGKKNSDISVSVGHNGRDAHLCYVAFSIKDEIAKKMLEKGSTWTCGLVSDGSLERLYILPDEMGFSLWDNDASSRHYTRIRVDELAPFDKYTGEHRLQFDDYNDAYYVTATE